MDASHFDHRRKYLLSLHIRAIGTARRIRRDPFISRPLRAALLAMALDLAAEARADLADLKANCF